ncbi:SH3 domain-containing protein [Streptomyces sp. NPDC005859]|uniref:SH3 domain-containing protein n=1 Tax=Streptomyces sp. NPDC005859 TaxID=3157170 RepID=UPI0033D11046
MSLRTALTRLAIVTAAGALAATAAVTPALADDWDGEDGFSSQDGGSYDWQNQGGDGGQNNQGNQNGGQGNQNGQGNQSGGGNGWQSGGNGNNWQNGGGDGGNDWQNGGDGGGNWQNGNGNGNQNDSRRYRGRVTASELLLRSAPTRASQVIRVAHRGEIVSIFCKTPGQNVQGNSLWYLLTDGTWAWGSARYIDTIGKAPRWC